MKKIIIFLCLFFVSVMGVSASSKFKVSLNECVDGDTAKFFIDGEVKTVRFLSINTPEIKHGGNSAEAYGDEASEYTCNALTNAKSIKLQYDPKSDEIDKYGRVLAWVFVDNELLQEKLIREGLAQVKYAYDDYLYTSDLKSLEVIAQESHLGMWAGDIIPDSVVPSNRELFMYSLALLAIIIVTIWGSSASKKKKAIKSIKKLANIK